MTDLQAWRTTGWQLRAVLGFKPRKDSLEANAHIFRPSCQPNKQIVGPHVVFIELCLLSTSTNLWWQLRFESGSSRRQPFVCFLQTMRSLMSTLICHKTPCLSSNVTVDSQDRTPTGRLRGECVISAPSCWTMLRLWCYCYLHQQRWMDGSYVFTIVCYLANKKFVHKYVDRFRLFVCPLHL